MNMNLVLRSFTLFCFQMRTLYKLIEMQLDIHWLVRLHNARAKRVLALLLSMAFFLYVPASIAHQIDTPDTVIYEDDAIKLGQIFVEKQVEAGRLDESWKNSTVEEVTQQQAPYGTIWIVNRVNTAIEDQKLRNLFIYFNDVGAPLAANYIGESN